MIDIDDPAYEVWLTNLAKDCDCCGNCWGCPCGGCQGGGICDAMPCHCYDRDDVPDEPQSRDDLDAEDEAP